MTTLDLLDRLIAFDTVSHKSNLPLIDWAQAYLAERGFAVTRFPDQSGTKAGICAILGPGDGGIVLSSHTDVVPVAGQTWTRDPFRLTIEGDRLYGRGTTDMKGFVAASLAAAGRAARLPLKAPLILVLSYDEEVGCTGIARMIGALAPHLGRPRACIVGEPTEMAVATGHKGKAAFSAICHGQAGHSALAPRYVNALHLAADFLNGLRALQDDLAINGARDPAYDIPHATLHAGRLTGGTALNIVPDRAELEFELRYLAADDPAALRRRLDRLADTAAATCRSAFPNARIDIVEGAAYPGLDAAANSESSRLVKNFCGIPQTVKVAFGTEAGFFAARNIPTVVCGPGSMADQGHKPDEYVTRAQLAACDAMLDRALDSLT